MSWFEKLMPSRIRTDAGHKRAVPEGLWTKCPGCSAILYRAEMERNLDVCPKCNHHNRISARRRLETFLDPEPQEEIGANLESVDPLKFRAGATATVTGPSHGFATRAGSYESAVSRAHPPPPRLRPANPAVSKQRIRFSFITRIILDPAPRSGARPPRWRRRERLTPCTPAPR